MMKTKMKQFFWLLTLAASSLFIACSDDGDTKVVIDTAALEAKIQEATDLLAASTEGTATGQFQLGSKAILQGAVDLAQQVADSEAVTQVQVDNSVTTLSQAITTFNESAIVPIAPNDLSAHWTFDDGSGTTVTDYSGNSLDGTFRTGHAAFGGGDPAWATDRYGNANKAVSFNEGAWIEVPYNAAINPSEITIALWVNTKDTRANNRFMGLHSWNGYKFQLQDAPKSFFTAATVADGIYDRDTEPVLTTDTWYHLAVTFGGGNMTFYVNGIKGNEHDCPGSMAPVANHNLAIGVGSSKYADVDTNYDTDQIIPAAWGGFFNGTLDDVRIYSAVLTGSQIKSIYDLEKAP
jgi:hypothetical protein